MADGGARGENVPMRASVRNPGRRRCEGRRGDKGERREGRREKREKREARRGGENREKRDQRERGIYIERWREWRENER